MLSLADSAGRSALFAKGSVTACSFSQAVQISLDILQCESSLFALFGNQPESLLNEPRIWRRRRRPPESGRANSKAGGSPSSLITARTMPARSTALAGLARRQAARQLPAAIRPAFATAAAARPSSLARAAPLRAFSSTPRRAGGNVPARADYKKLTAADIEAFKSFLSTPASSLFTTIASPDGSWTPVNEDDLIGYNKDWMDKYIGHSQLLLKPKSTEEVSKIMAYCYKERIAVVPQGGNTGLVGGGTPVYDEVILSTEAMKEVRHFDDVSGAFLSCRSRSFRSRSPC